jgi:hypothetical protein
VKLKTVLQYGILITCISPFIISAIILISFLTAYIGVIYGHTFRSNTLLNDYQGYLYYNGMRTIWQAKRDCVDFDSELLYIPKIGSCNFNNTEFDNQLNFDEFGRIRPLSSLVDRGGAIAVVGDSHSMGWGVGDAETYSYILANKLSTPIFNLAVSSYGTYRELLRLEKTGLHEKVKTIIIQYCDNDIEENTAFLEKRPVYTIDQFNILFETQVQKSSVEIYIEWLQKAFELARMRIMHSEGSITEIDFNKHMEALTSVIRMFPWLGNKKIYIIYSNAHGTKFKDFEKYRIDGNPNIRFIEIGLGRGHYYTLDDHLNASGHIKIAEYLATLLRE